MRNVLRAERIASCWVGLRSAPILSRGVFRPALPAGMNLALPCLLGLLASIKVPYLFRGKVMERTNLGKSPIAVFELPQTAHTESHLTYQAAALLVAALARGDFIDHGREAVELAFLVRRRLTKPTFRK